MAAYAEDFDLKEYDDDIFDHNVSSFEAEIIRASADVLNKIKSEWWPKAIESVSSEDHDTGLMPATLDEQYLNTAALKQITIFRALFAYIYPRLSTFIDGDTSREKAAHYKTMFNDEWKVIKGLPLYDFDKDSTFEDTERRGPIGRRLVRGT